MDYCLICEEPLEVLSQGENEIDFSLCRYCGSEHVKTKTANGRWTMWVYKVEHTGNVTRVSEQAVETLEKMREAYLAKVNAIRPKMNEYGVITNDEFTFGIDVISEEVRKLCCGATQAELDTVLSRVVQCASVEVSEARLRAAMKLRKQIKARKGKK